MQGKIILLSRTIAGSVGYSLVKKQICDNNEICNKRILIFAAPYYAEYENLFLAAVKLGFSKEKIAIWDENIKSLDGYDYLYVNEGNTFEILKELKTCSFYKEIKEYILSGKITYIGVSAGAVIAGKSIEVAFYGGDRNKICLDDFTGLGLVDYNIIPHCTRAEALKKPSAYINEDDCFIGNEEIVEINL